MGGGGQGPGGGMQIFYLKSDLIPHTLQSERDLKSDRHTHTRPQVFHHVKALGLQRMAGKLQATSVATQRQRGSGNCSATANTWLASRAGPLTGLSVAGFSSLGVPRSRGTARTARSSSRDGRRKRAARGPEGGMAAWSVGGGEVEYVCPKTPPPPGPRSLDFQRRSPPPSKNQDSKRLVIRT